MEEPPRLQENYRNLEQLIELLKQKYLKNSQIERLFYPDFPLPLEHCYLHLALIEEKEINKLKETGVQDTTKEQNKIKEKSETISQRDHCLRDYERIEHLERKLDVKDLLAEAKNAPRRIYIEGAAGAGKSTLSRYIVHQWALGKSPWNHYLWVFHIRLRELTENSYTEKNTELLKVLERECFGLGHGNDLKEEEKELLKNDMRQNPQQVLLVLDGVDELQLTTNYVREVWQSLVNSGYDLLFTSRHGAQLIKRDLRINLNLGVLGFSDEQIEAYVNNFFDSNNTPNAKVEDAAKCLDVLRSNPNLWSLAHTPIQLELLCSIWGEELKQQDLNLTDLYCLMLEKLFKRYEQLILKQQGQIVSLDDIDIEPLKNKFQHQLQYMEYLAFLGMQEKIIVLSEKHINEAFNRLPKDAVKGVEFYRILKGIGLVKRYNNGKQAEFVHLTFQEFFAARYIARAIKAFCEGKAEGLSHEALFKFISKTKSDPFYEVMWWFVAGLLAGKTPQNQELEKYRYQTGENSDPTLSKIPDSHLRLQRLQTFFDLLLQEPRNPVRFQELLLLTRCLDEAKMPNIMQKDAIANHVFYYYSHCIDDYEYPFIPNFRYPYIERIRSLIKANPTFVKANKLLFETFLLKQLKKLDGDRLTDLIKLFPEKIIPVCLEASKHHDKYVRHKAINALEIVGAQDLNTIVPVMLEALKDHDKYVRQLAVKYLGQLGAQAQENIISALKQALTDADNYVRTEAVKALGKLGIQYPEKVIPTLLKLNGQYEFGFVRIYAILALKEIAFRIPQKVIPILLEALKNDYYDTVNSVIPVLKKLLSTDPNNVIPTLLQALKDNDTYLRLGAAKALGHTQSIDAKKVIPELIKALKDEDWSLRETIVTALGNIGAVSLDEVIPVVILQLKSRYMDVPAAAAYALGKIGFKAPKKVIPTLLEALNYNDPCTISAAVQALGNIGAASPDEVIPAVILQLKSRFFNVRPAAAYTLGKIGFQAPEKVIPTLLEALNDNDPGIISAAAQALGNVGSHSAEKIVPALLKSLHNKAWEVRCSIIETLGKFGAHAPEKIIPALFEALKDLHEKVSSTAIKVLEEFLPQGLEKIIPLLLEALKDPESKLRGAAATALGKLGSQHTDKIIPALLEAIKDSESSVSHSAVIALGNIGASHPDKIIPPLLSNQIFDRNSFVIVPLALKKISSKFPDKVSFYLVQLISSFPQDKELRKMIIILILYHIKVIPLKFLIFSMNELLPDQPPSIPPSYLIRSSKDVVKVDDKGKLSTLILCGEMLVAIIRNNQENHLISQDFWAVSIVRNRSGTRNDNASPGFFKSIKFTNGLFDHAFIIIEGVKQNVRFATKIDLFAVSSSASQSSGQRIRIEITDIDDFNRLQKLAENCGCIMQGIPRQKAEQLLEIIKRDQAAAERGEIIYNIRGDGSFSASRDKKEHSCISWNLEKWQEIGLPLQRKWYDTIGVVPKAYLPVQVEQSSCQLM